MATITEKLKWLIEADATSAIKGFEETGAAAEKSLGKAKTSQEKLSGQLTKVGAGAVAVSGIVGVALIKAAGSFEDLALKAGQGADATGLTVDQASRWIEVSGDMGIGFDTVETAIGKMNKTLGASPGKFEELGIKVATTKGGIEDVNGTFLNVIDRLNQIEDPAARAAAAAEIFGKGWQGSAELLKLSTDDIKTQLQSVSDQKVISPEELQKAKDYRDNLDTLKDSFENLALAIGEGAAPAIGGIAKLIGGAVQGIADLDAVTGGAAGSLLVGGAAALGMFGAITLATGQILKMKTAFQGMGPVGEAAMIGVGLATIAYTLDAQDSAKATANLKTSIEDLSKVSDADLLKTFIDTIVKGYFAEKDLKQTTDELATSNMEGALRVKEMIEAHIAAGTATQNEKDAIVPLIQSIKDAKDAEEQGKATKDKYKDTTEDTTAKTLEQEAATNAAKAALDGIKAATDAAKEKSDAYAKSLQGQIDKLDALYPKEYDAVKAKYDYAQQTEDTMLAVGNMNTVLGDHKSKQEDIKTATDNARDAIISQSEKFATLTGDADKSEGAIRRQITSLEAQRDTLAPNSPLRQFLDQYIADLAAIPSNISTIMDLHISQGSVTTAAGDTIGQRVGIHGAGGTIPMSEAVSLVGDKGPELISAPGYHVTPNNALGGTATYNINVQPFPGIDPYRFGQYIVNALAAYHRNNGTG